MLTFAGVYVIMKLIMRNNTVPYRRMIIMTLVKIEANCRLCNNTQILKVKESSLHSWQQGELIQNAMPELTPNEREMLVSRTCGDCWDKMFSEE